jgi:dynein heavy chain
VAQPLQPALELAAAKLTITLRGITYTAGVPVLYCVVLHQVISTNTADAETKQKAAQEKEATLQVESVQIAKDKEEAEQALSEAIPALEDAAAALNDLKKDDITEIRSFAKPHILVQRVSGSQRAS